MNDYEWAVALVKLARQAEDDAAARPGTGFEQIAEVHWACAACAMLTWALTPEPLDEHELLNTPGLR